MKIGPQSSMSPYGGLDVVTHGAYVSLSLKRSQLQ